MKTAAKKQPVKKLPSKLQLKKKLEDEIRRVEAYVRWLNNGEDDSLNENTFEYCCGAREIGSFCDDNYLDQLARNYNDGLWDDDEIKDLKLTDTLAKKGYKKYIEQFFKCDKMPTVATILVKDQSEVLTMVRSIARKNPGKFIFKNFTNPSTKNELVMVIYIP